MLSSHCLYLIDTKVSNSMGHSAGAQESLEMLDLLLDGILNSFDHPALSRAEQGRARTANVVCCSLNCRVRLKRALGIS